MTSRDASTDPDSTDRLLSDLGHIIDEAEIVGYIVRISDKIHQLKLDQAPPNKIKDLSDQLSLLENKLAGLRLIRRQ